MNRSISSIPDNGHKGHFQILGTSNNLRSITVLLSVPLVPEKEVFLDKVDLFSSIRGTFVCNLKCFDICGYDFQIRKAMMCCMIWSTWSLMRWAHKIDKKVPVDCCSSTKDTAASLRHHRDRKGMVKSSINVNVLMRKLNFSMKTDPCIAWCILYGL